MRNDWNDNDGTSLLWFFGVLCWLAFWITVIYVGYHFIHKYW